MNHGFQDCKNERFIVQLPEEVSLVELAVVLIVLGDECVYVQEQLLHLVQPMCQLTNY